VLGKTSGFGYYGENQPPMKQKIARLVTNVVNPFAVSAVVLVVLAFRESPDVGHAVLWTVVTLVLSVVPVLLVMVVLVRRRRVAGMFNNPRRQRFSVYGIAVTFGCLGLLALWSGGGPKALRLTFIAGIIALAVFMTVNFYWKISLHTAFIAGTATVFTIAVGGYGALVLLLLPAVGWSRWALGQHSLAQVSAGAIGAAGIVTAVFAVGGYL
jgi:hypothetical protein